MQNKEIRVKMNGGYLVAQQNPDPNYDGISVFFESDDGQIIDVAIVECKEENGRNNIDAYLYENVFTDEWTKKFTLKGDDIRQALE